MQDAKWTVICYNTPVRGFRLLSKAKVGVINVTGYTGVELARLLHQHPEVELTSVTGRSAAGQRLGDVFPSLAGADLTIETELRDVDFAFSAMPHQESAKVVIPLLERGIKVVDISADFRLKDAAEYLRCWKKRCMAYRSFIALGLLLPA